MVLRSRLLKGIRRQTYVTLTSLFAVRPAVAQVVIPYGDFENDFEKYLVVAVTLAALIFAMWRYFKAK
jgi:hypothetical protein